MSRTEFTSDEVASMKRKIKAIVFGVVVLFAACSSYHVVPAGHRAVKFNRFSGVSNYAYPEGIAFKMPVVEDMIDMKVQIDKVEEHASAASHDLQNVGTTVTLNFRIDPDKAPHIYQSIGLGFKQVLFTPAIQEAVKSITSRYTAEQLITQREEVKNLIQASLVERLQSHGFIMTALNITDFKFSESFTHAIEEKVTAEQNALAAKNKLEQIRFEADQRVVAAEGEAKAQRALALTITQQTLELRRLDVMANFITKWNGTPPQTWVIGGNPNTMLSIGAN